jgi:hypothetical protein
MGEMAARVPKEGHFGLNFIIGNVRILCQHLFALLCRKKETGAAENICR